MQASHPSKGRSVVLVTLLLLFAGNATLASEQSLTGEPGVLRIGTSGDYPPFSRGGEGFDVAVARRLAADLDLDIVWVPFRWPTLTRQVADGDFDLAMGGITWRAERAAVSPMSRSLAQGGPCLVGSTSPERVAVNRGGILERWARSRFDEDQVTTTDDNLELPELLEDGRVQAFVTDSFEVQHFAAGRTTSCEPPIDRKAYWFAPGRERLAEAVDRWIESQESLLRKMRATHFGAEQPRSPEEHVVDLLSRRFAFMPHVARYKAQKELPLTDLDQEARILDGAAVAALERSLDAERVRRFFALCIDLAKRVQARTEADAPTLDLQTQIRPALVRLTPRILDALLALERSASFEPDTTLLAPLTQWLTADEVAALADELSTF